jgi:hypothetical protein
LLQQEAVEGFVVAQFALDLSVETAAAAGLVPKDA